MPAKPIIIDFTEYERNMKLGQGGRVLLLKATGLTKTKGLRILDATAGLLRDAFFMAKHGGIVTAIERSPVLADMIESAWVDLPGEIALTFLEGDAITLIPNLPPFDVIYVDPMFREEKSAKAKKDLQFLQQLHQDAVDDSEALFKTALQFAKSRVVVKRATHADHLAGIKPDFSYQGKTIRFDIYITK
jgi:16S rRNA (guanine1516-N2)-methyltransferase